MEKNKYVHFATCDSFRWSRSHICYVKTVLCCMSLQCFELLFSKYFSIRIVLWSLLFVQMESFIQQLLRTLALEMLSSIRSRYAVNSMILSGLMVVLTSVTLYAKIQLFNVYLFQKL